MKLKDILNPKPIVESNVKVGNMYMVHGYPLLKGLFPNKYYKIDSINGDNVTLKQVNKSGQETNFTGEPVIHKLSSIEASIQSVGNGEVSGLELTTEATAPEVIKDLDKVKNDLLKKVDVLVAKKKKLYSNVDIESPMSADEKKLDKDIADLFSQINKLVLQKRSLKNENKMLRLRDLLNEAKFPIYHKTYTSAINSALEWAEKQGFEYDKEETADKIGMGPKKPSEGKTNKFSISLTKGGKEQKKMLHIQVYNMGTFKRNSDGSRTRSMWGGQNEYELNCYIG